jgi:hypothetical protein
VLDTGAAEQPALQTVSSTFPVAGVLGIGALFVALVAGGYVLLRRRAGVGD